MPILPLPQFEADLKQAELEEYERLRPPTSIVVRFGALKMVGEYPYSGDAKPGCGSKLVVRTHRGVELAEMLTSTCPNAGCSKSVTRKQMLEYIENSGGSEYPFFTEGRVLRVATIADMNEQSRIEAMKPAMLRAARESVATTGLPMKVVDAEPLLGGERLTFYYTSEDRVDFRDLVHVLAKQYSTRIEMRQVGARDEARITADYERCGQHCCCKQFLKVLKPVSMRSAKVQKATLDPLKISGRCGRLMCCLRYEDETYETLRKKLPHMKTRVGTPEGPGIVIDAQILTQLVLVLLDGQEKRVAVPVEELTEPGPAPAPMAPGADPRGRRDTRPRGGPGSAPVPGSVHGTERRPGGAPAQGRDRGPGERRDGGRRDQPRRDQAPPGAAPSGAGAPEEGQPSDPLRGMDPARLQQRVEGRGQDARQRPPREQQQDDYRRRSQQEAQTRIDQPAQGDSATAAHGAPELGPDGQPRRKKKRRRRRRRGGGDGSSGGSGGASGGGSEGSGGSGGSGSGPPTGGEG